MKIHIENLEQLPKTAQALLAEAKQHRVIALRGTMGVGKTTLIKACCAVLSVTELVSSPSFSIVNEYLDAHETSIYHFDFYRINKLQEIIDMGYQMYFDSGNYCFIEWPENIEPLLPDDTLNVYLELLDDGSRSLQFDSR